MEGKGKGRNTELIAFLPRLHPPVKPALDPLHPLVSGTILVPWLVFNTRPLRIMTTVDYGISG